MADHQAIAVKYLDRFCKTFDDYGVRRNMAAFFRPESTFTWDGTHITGIENIIDYRMNNTPKNIKSYPSTIDSQPGANGSIVMMVTGYFIIDGNHDKPVNYVGLLILMPDPQQPGGYYIQTDMLRCM